MNTADLLDVSGNRVLITGASRGIGRGLVAAHGADIVAVARDETELAEVEGAGRT